MVKGHQVTTHIRVVVNCCDVFFPSPNGEVDVLLPLGQRERGKVLLVKAPFAWDSPSIAPTISLKGDSLGGIDFTLRILPYPISIHLSNGVAFPSDKP